MRGNGELSGQTNHIEDKKWPAPLLFGIGASLLWAIVLIAYASSRDDKNVSHFWTLWYSNPDVFGNALAGVFAPLAFLWLVVATLLQSSELQLQREELKLSREELRDSVAQLSNHTALMQDEQKSRTREILENNFEHQLIKWALDCSKVMRMSDDGNYHIRWISAQDFSQQKSLQSNAFSIEHFSSVDQLERCYGEVETCLNGLNKLSTPGNITLASSKCSLGDILASLQSLADSGREIVAVAKTFTSSKALAILAKIRFEETLGGLIEAIEKFRSDPNIDAIWKKI